ncbi:hypothetical protein BD311DRAFT_20133 [Dichomitus squalens]|uniref:Uncharacterized protein n=1 Tax=Dichomitus squalens TaxID=114155 RepID=A0A4Q9N5F5_9APHY|nr:hypothetical protein BD311DRAFT_20133 [Dichomitus squalens]
MALPQMHHTRRGTISDPVRETISQEKSCYNWHKRRCQGRNLDGQLAGSLQICLNIHHSWQYNINLPNWGPGVKQDGKRKRNDDD